ncbi:aspartyl/asparaginyl beta-hydroxylase domain-containing protein [Phenylobacterium sp.]|uniref:aspartyl/asparaginyl beta-hydroxylase domain-containing protein n=1 Tax=Phenylobacterium sp. TaxID=1871053 RepID=UPI0012230E9A|nr:aspartyl/asparaginyl beta-hydroxylase domain-containing protein [Phenylobacterium sp.]THD52243.1 MAG: tetratricopeptide repeat protein [Phenylobacterium sp.]
MSEVVDGRVRQLIDAASRALATGQTYDAERLVRQAENEAPSHPLVLNEIGKRKLLAGDAAGGLAMLEQALAEDPGNPTFLLNFATALRDLNRRDEELAALNRVLAAEPTNMRALLQAAALHEHLKDSRAAAATYRKVLMLVPTGVQVPADMRPIFAHAQSVVDANGRALENFLDAHLQEVRARHASEPLGRFDKSLATYLQKRRVYRPQPTFLYVPELPAIEFYPREDFPWLEAIEAAADDIREELVGVLADGAQVLEPYIALQATPDEKWRALNNSRSWGVFYLWKAGHAMVENMARFPKAMAALEAWPKCELPGSAPTAVFSILEPRTRIPPHTGVNNARLICHLPLIVPPGCGFRVGAETRQWEPGKAFVFDDTIEHEAWNNSGEARAVLIFDIWNPYVTPAEREMVSALTVGVEQFYGSLPSYL